MPNTLPFGTQFSPNQIELPQLLQLIIDNEGDDTAPLITAIVDTFFSTNATEQQRNMAGNCKKGGQGANNHRNRARRCHPACFCGWPQKILVSLVLLRFSTWHLDASVV